MPADMQILVRHIRRMAGRGRFAKDSDRLLLESYVRDGNEDAFATLVARHAALVAGVCRRVLVNTQDIEDVFQATFLVLARKAGAVRWHESIANWLHGVAHRLALRTRADAARQQALLHAVREGAIAAEPPQQTRELQIILDEELDRLPEPQRLPLILCYLEGRTRDEAARQCGWSLRTLERRLEQGRGLLRDRLIRRGLDLSVILLAAALSEQSGSANTQLTSATLKFLEAAKAASGLSGGAVLRLAETALPIAGAGYLKLAAGMMLALAVTGLGAYAWFSGSINDFSSAARAAKEDPPPVEENNAPIRNARPDAVGQPLPQGALRLGSEQFRGSGFGIVQYSTDGKRLITAGSGGIQVFDGTSGINLLRAGAGLPFSQWSTAISADGRLAAIADPTGAKRGFVFDVATGRQICELQTPAKRTTNLTCFSRDGALLAALVSQVCVDLYDTASGKLVRSLQWEEKYMPPSNYSIYWGDVGFLADDKSMVVSVHHTGVIRVFDIASGNETRQMIVSPNGMAGMALSPDGKILVSLPCVPHEKRASGFREESDESVQVLEAATGKQLAELLIPQITKTWLLIGPDNKTLFASSGSSLGMWNLATTRKVGEVPFPSPRSLKMSFGVSPNGQTIACPVDSVLHQINVKTGNEAPALAGHVAPISAVAFSPTGSLIATGGNDGKIILWERSTGEQVRQMADPGASVQQLLFGRDARLLYMLSYRSGRDFPAVGRLRSFTVAEGKEVWRANISPIREPRPGRGRTSSNPNARISAIAINGDQLAALKDDSIALMDASTGKLIREQHLASKQDEQQARGFVTALAYSKNTNDLLAWTRGQTLWRGDWAMNKMINQPCPDAMRLTRKENDVGRIEFENMPQAAAFSPDGKLLALGGYPPYIQLLSVETGKEVRRIMRSSKHKDSFVHQIAFAPDGRTVAWSESDEKSVYLSNVASGLLVRKLPPLSAVPTSLAYSSDGKTLAVGCIDSTAIVWDLAKLPQGN